MGCIADDYHSLEGDVGVDAPALRARIEQLLDSLDGWTMEVSLSTIPEPVLHPLGVIICAEIQVDAEHPVSRERRTIVDRRVALLEKQADQAWAISSLSPMPA
jgi:hypothetical protein